MHGIPQRVGPGLLPHNKTFFTKEIFLLSHHSFSLSSFFFRVVLTLAVFLFLLQTKANRTKEEEKNKLNKKIKQKTLASQRPEVGVQNAPRFHFHGVSV